MQISKSIKVTLETNNKKTNSTQLTADSWSLEAGSYQINKEEISIIRTLYKFPETVFEAGANLSPNYICAYLYDLASKFNHFYRKHKVLDAPEDEKQFRIELTQAVAQVIKNGLNLLGIEVLEKM